MEVGIGELREGLSGFLAQVRQGRTVTITDDGRPIARIVPIAEMRVQPATRRKRAAPDPVVGNGTMSDLVADQRR